MTNDNAETLRMIGELKGELGEVRGQLRELIHNTNNMRQVLENQLRDTHRISGILSDIEHLETRVTVLEAKENQRTGALTLSQFVFRSPLLGWLIGASAMIYAILGR